MAAVSGPTSASPYRPSNVGVGSFLPRVTEDTNAASTSSGTVTGIWHDSGSITADGVVHEGTFDRVPCRYLAHCGVAASDSAFAEDLYPDDGSTWSTSRGGIRRSSATASAVSSADIVTPLAQHHLMRLSSDSHTRSILDDGFGAGSAAATVHCEDYQHSALGTAVAGQSNHEPNALAGSAVNVAHGKPALVQRSLSDMGRGAAGLGSSSADEALPAAAPNSVGSSRRGDRQRKAGGVGGSGDGGLSLLTAPSPSMSLLIELARSEPGSLVAAIAQRPSIAFVRAEHDLAALRAAMQYVAGKAACRIHALKAFEWMLRNVSSAGSIHDVLWHFVTALITTPATKDASSSIVAKEEGPKKASSAVGPAAAAAAVSSAAPEREEQDGAFEHPLTDVLLAGVVVLQPLQAALHSLLRIVSDVMMYLPSGSPAQQMAIGCFCLRFQPNDHQFLHSSHVFSNISQILSKSDDEVSDDDTSSAVASLANGSPAAAVSNGSLGSLDHSFVASLKDITHLASVTVSSRPGMIASLRDGSTETFWESGDEDKNRTKEIVAQLPAGCTVGSLFVYIDNGRDVQNKVSSVGVHCGRSSNTLAVMWSHELDGGHCGWVGWEVPATGSGGGTAPAIGGSLVQQPLMLKVELKGSSNSLRVRQLKVLGFSAAPNGDPSATGPPPSAAATDLAASGAYRMMTAAAQQKNCEAETLRVFRWLTSLVFGRLTGGSSGSAATSADGSASGSGGSAAASLADDGLLLATADEEADLKEHMVGILFSRSRLSHLQRLVCTHIVHGIRKETSRIYDDWSARCCCPEEEPSAAASAGGGRAVGRDRDGQQQQAGGSTHTRQPTDAYCFELLSMVLALSGSRVGRAHLAEQADLLSDLLKLLHAASPRVRRQVLLLLRRILPDVSPVTFAKVVGASTLPPHQLISVFAQQSGGGNQHGAAAAPATAASAGSDRPACGSEAFGALDVFLSCISKALTVQLKRKGVKSLHSIAQADCLKAAAGAVAAAADGRWWMRGSMPEQTASGVALLLSDMSAGRLSEQWAAVTKAAIGEAILQLTKLRREGGTGSDAACEHLLSQPALWLALAALCIVSPDHASMLSSASSAAVGGASPQGATVRAAGTAGSSEPNDGGSGQPLQQQRLCSNHDDGLMAAMLWCAECASSLCADCDRFLHLSKAKRTHRRQIFREEEESIKIDLHEGCGRAKVFWFLAFADSRTLKAVVELRASHLYEVEAVTDARATSAAAAAAASGLCRFCGNPAVPLTVDGLLVCSEAACQEHCRRACLKALPCGHGCCGVRDEQNCLPCLHGCEGEAAGRESGLRQDADDMCVICFSDALTAAPTIQLQCGHLYHLHCCEQLLQKRWKGPRISFTFCKCCICKAEIDHPALADLLKPIRALQEDVKRKALMRLNYDGLLTHAKVTSPGSAFFNDPLGLALDRYAYYVCFKCGKAYYGGQVRCQQNTVADEYDPSELVCGGCSDVARAQMCPKHGTDYLEYKCRYCCSVAVFFCFGTTHFCNLCHDDFQRITSLPKSQLPICPAGPRAVQMQAEDCPLHVVHPPTGEEYALGCGICRHIHTF